MLMANNKPSMFDPYKDWIFEHMHDYKNMTELMNALRENFGLDVKRPTLKDWFWKNYGKTIYGSHEFSEEEKELIKKYYPDNGAEKTAEVINIIFGTNRTYNSVIGTASKMGVKCSREYTRDQLRKNGIKNGFIKSVDEGTIRLETVKGVKFYRMKTQNGWKPAGRAVWEQHNGPIPKGYKIIYLDGNSLNYDISKLAAVNSQVQYQVICHKSYKLGDPELTKTLIQYYELRNALGMDCYQFQSYMRKFERLIDKEECI